MKRGFQKSLALLLAVFMTFGAVPFFGVSMLASAEDIGSLKAISINPDSFDLEVGKTKELQISGAYRNDTTGVVTSKSVPASKVSWSTSNDKYATISSEGVVSAVAVPENGKPITIYITAFVSEDPSIYAQCAVKVVKAPIFVDTLEWKWKKTTLLAGDGEVYSFAYNAEKLDENMYRIAPINADTKSATLTCTPVGALSIDNAAKTFTVNELDKNTEKLTVTLTLTADGAKEGKEVKDSIQITIVKDIPITGIKWNFKVGSTNKTGFSFYEKNDAGKPTDKIAVYYYKPTELGSKTAAFRYETIPANDIYLELCDITVKSSDKRVVTFDDTTGRLIPVGNGEAKITVTAKTPKGKQFEDTVIAVVSNSKYTPITEIKFGYDEKNTSEDVTYDSKENTLSLMYNHEIQLTAAVGKEGASLKNESVVITLDDGRKVTYAKPCTYKWTSDDESIAKVDQNGKVTVTGNGTTTIKLTVDDNGTAIVQQIKVKGGMTWWEVLVAVLMCIFSGRWNKIPTYLKALFG